MKYNSYYVSCLLGVSVIVSSAAFAAEWISLERVEASVNSSLILRSEVEKLRTLIPLRSQLDPLFGQTVLASKGDAASNLELTEYLIDEKMVQQLFSVADPEVEQEVNSIQANNHIDRPGLKAALKEQGFNFDDYFEIIRASISKRNLIDREIRTKVSITDDDVKNYFFNKVAKNTATSLSYVIKLIKLSPSSYKSTAALKEMAQKAAQSLKEGDAFDEVMKRFSDDASAATGGELGPMAENQLSPLFKDQLKKLKIGETSPLLGDTSHGYFILKLIDLKTSDSAQLEKMKDEIRNQLFTSEYQHQISLWLERQKQKTFIHRAQAL